MSSGRLLRQLVTIYFVACALAAGAQPAASQERPLHKRVIGVVMLPRVFGTPTALDSDDLIRAQPGISVALRERPSRSAPVVGTISNIDEAQAVEAGYEIPAAVVYGQQGSWLLLRTAKGIEGWVEEKDRGRYYGINALLQRSSYLTDAWDGRIFDAPNGRPITIPPNPARLVKGVLEWRPERISRRGRQDEPRELGCSFSGRVDNPIGIIECPTTLEIALYSSPDPDAPIHARFNTAQDMLLDTLAPGRFGFPVFRFPVFDTAPGWYRVALAGTQPKEKVWIQDRAEFVFRPVETSEQREALAGEVWPFEQPAIQPLETRTVDGVPWLRINLLTASTCSGEPDQRIVASGWVPAYASTNELTTWYYARGC